MSVSTLVPTASAHHNLTLGVRPLVESRPPGRSWWHAETAPVAPLQPPLDLADPAEVDPSRPTGAGAHATVVQARWTARARPDLPDPAEWSVALALAVLQAMLAQRPIAQLNRWLAEDVLSMVTVQQRRCRSEQARAARRVGVRSVRVQHPATDVAEVSAHVMVGVRDTAVAFRLEALGERWLCTAFQLDIRVLR
jgi:Family of unknown function (DUF6459)